MLVLSILAERSNVLGTLGGADTMETNDFNLIPFGNPDLYECPRPAQYPTRIEGTTGVLSDGKPVVCGGKDGDSNISDKCYQYQEDSDSWTLLATMLEPRDDLVSVQLNNGDFWILGEILILQRTYICL